MGQYYEPENEETPSGTLNSKYNSSWLISITLSNLWKDSYRHSRAGELMKWNADLDCLWIELGGDLREENKEDKVFIKNYTDIEFELSEHGSLSSIKQKGFRKNTPEDLIKFTKQYKTLMKKALFLKRLQNAKGKGTAYEDDLDDYMDF